MNLQVTLTAHAEQGEEQGSKRSYFPYEMTWVCPTCGEEQYRDFSSDYIGYPIFGKVNDVTVYCGECDEEGRKPCEFKVRLIPRLLLELAPVAEKPAAAHAPDDAARRPEE